jgi:hypothetical protein
MTSKEYVIWLKGFVEACHEYAPTPKQWDALKDKLAEVNDLVGTPIGPGIGIPNTTPNWQWPHYPNPMDNPYKITCQPGTTLTTTPGSGSISLGTSGKSLLFDASTTSYANAMSGSWHYTNSTYRPPHTTGGEDEIVKHHNED